MQNYTQTRQKCQYKSSLLRIKAYSDITELFGNSIPYPHNHYFKDNAIIYEWQIDGFFHTQKGIEFINDIIARFIISADCVLESFKATEFDYASKYKLKEFRGLKSLASDKIIDKLSAYNGMHDFIFWAIKLKAEDEIRNQGLIVYSRLEDWAFNNFIDNAKDKSTLRAKCRGVYNWYFDRDWKIGRVNLSKKTKEEIMATRTEHALNNSRNIAEKTKRKVLNIITGIFSHEYRRKNGNWNIAKIAKDSGTSRNTVMKYLPKETLF